MKPRVLIVDDDRDRSEVLARVFEGRFEPRQVVSLDDAFAAIGRGPWAAALVDYNLARDGNGLELLQALRDFSSHTFRVLYSVFYSEALVHDAERLASAHAVVDAKRPDFLIELRATIERLLSQPEPRALAAPGEAGPGVPVAEGWVAQATESRAFFEQLRRAAESDSAVFLYGELGAGKDFAGALLRDLRQAWRARPRRGVPTTPPVVILRVPSLRDRREDLPALAEHFLDRHARALGEAPKHLTNDAIDDLVAREWRGNVRELFGALLRAWQRAGARPGISAADLPRDLQPPVHPSQFAKDVGQLECVLRQLRMAGNVSAAARLEGISRTNYIRLMRRLGVVRADTQPTGEGEE